MLHPAHHAGLCFEIQVIRDFIFSVIYEVDTEEGRAFWKKMMDKYGTEKKYLEQIIGSFKQGPEPEILIVVSKLLTGFDAPRNTVLYLCRPFQEHNLLQAIARVNRVYAGKDFGFIVDYYGVLQKLGELIVIVKACPTCSARHRLQMFFKFRNQK